MVSQNERTTPHSIRGGVSVAGIPIRQSASSLKGVPPPLANLTVDEHLIPSDLSPMDTRQNQTLIEEQHPPVKVREASLKREVSKPSFTIRKGGAGGASKPFQIRRKEEAAP